MTINYGVSSEKNKVIVITGASDGIGKSAAEVLIKKGYRVVIVGRSPKKTKEVAKSISAEYLIADFSKLSEVRKLAKNLKNNYKRIDVLVNNAGAIFGERKLTEDGFEQTLQVNYLAHFLLTKMLMPKLISSSAVVIQTSSVAARVFGRLDIDDLQNEKKYSANRAYGDSKLANILFTRELDKRYRCKGISTVSFHPGNLSTNFGEKTTSWLRFLYRTPLARLFLDSPKKGGDLTVWLIEGKPSETWKLGEYYEGNQPAKKQNPKATDMKLAKELWECSEKMLGQMHEK